MITAKAGPLLGMAHWNIPGGSSVHRIRFYLYRMRRSVQILQYFLVSNNRLRSMQDGDRPDGTHDGAFTGSGRRLRGRFSY